MCYTPASTQRGMRVVLSEGSECLYIRHSWTHLVTSFLTGFLRRTFSLLLSTWGLVPTNKKKENQFKVRQILSKFCQTQGQFAHSHAPSLLHGVNLGESSAEPERSANGWFPFTQKRPLIRLHLHTAALGKPNRKWICDQCFKRDRKAGPWFGLTDETLSPLWAWLIRDPNHKSSIDQASRETERGREGKISRYLGFTHRLWPGVGPLNKNVEVEEEEEERGNVSSKATG